MIEGFIYKNISKNVQQAVAHEPLARAVLITKASIQKYIASFLDTKGYNKPLLQCEAPIVQQYVTDKSLEADWNNTSKRHIFLARLFSKLKEHLPTILIAESAIVYEPSGLGDWFRSQQLSDGKLTVSVDLHLTLTINIIVGAHDEETHSILVGALTLMFGPLRRLAGGDFFRCPTPGTNYEVKMPINFVPPIPEPLTLGDDPTDRAWIGTFTMDNVRYEGVSILEYEIGKHMPDPFAGLMSWWPDVYDLSARFPVRIVAPNRVRLGQSVRVFIERRRPNSRVFLDKPALASINLSTMTLRPKRLGAVTIYVVDEKFTSTESNPELIHAKHVVNIVY